MAGIEEISGQRGHGYYWVRFNVIPLRVLFFLLRFGNLVSLFKKPLLERLSIALTSNGTREFVPRDQVSPFHVVYCSLFLHLNSQYHAIFYP